MKINPISHINFIIKNVNSIRAPKLNYDIKDTVSFSGQKSAKRPVIDYETYEAKKELDTTRTRSIFQMREAYKRGEDIEEDRIKLILSRIPKALSDAQNFVSEHPEFDVKGIGQDLIKIVSEKTDFEICESKSKYRTFTTLYEQSRDLYFKKKVTTEPRKNYLRANYPDMLRGLDLAREKTVAEMREARQRGEDISSDREKLILSRIPRALSDAETFCQQNPQFNREDVEQDLVHIVIRATDWNLNQEGEYDIFASSFEIQKDYYFKRILEQEKKIGAAQELEVWQKEQLPQEVYAQMERGEFIEELKEDFKKAIGSLKPEYQAIIMRRFGLDGGKPMTLDEIGKEFFTSSQNIHQKEEKAIRDFKKAYLNIQLMKKMGGSYED